MVDEFAYDYSHVILPESQKEHKRTTGNELFTNAIL